MRISTSTTLELGGTTCSVAELKSALTNHDDNAIVTIEYSPECRGEIGSRDSARLIIEPRPEPQKGVVPR